IRLPKIDKLKSAREIARNVSRLTIQDSLELIVRGTHSRPDQVLLILACKLAAGDKQEGAVLSHCRTGPIAEAAEPDVQIFLKFGRFLLGGVGVGDERDMGQTECLLEDCMDFSLKSLFGGII